MHHRQKKDSPSGTARRLAEILAEVRNLSYENDCRHGRSETSELAPTPRLASTRSAEVTL